MSRNVRALLGVSVLCGVGAGLYEFILPFYLQEQGLSFSRMGYLFAVSTAALFAVRLGAGQLVDAWGCKGPYLWSLVATGWSSVGTAFTANLGVLMVVKTLRDVGLLVRDTVHPILLFLDDRFRFRDSIGKTRGLDYLFQAAGPFLAGLVMASLGNAGCLVLSGVLLLVASALLGLGVREPAAEPGAEERKPWTWSLLDLDPNLRVIMFSSFIFTIGLMTSHCFILQLFFAEKFGVSQEVVAHIMTLHRLTTGIPLLLAGRLVFRNLKLAYVGTLVWEGIFIGLGGLIPTFLPATILWLLHDLVGAGVWIPIQNEIIQRYCREGSRGLDLGKTLALSSIGGALGPLLAGYLAPLSISAPFVVSGILVLVAGLMLLKLDLRRPENG